MTREGALREHCKTLLAPPTLLSPPLRVAVRIGLVGHGWGRVSRGALEHNGIRSGEAGCVGKTPCRGGHGPRHEPRTCHEQPRNTPLAE